MPPWCLYILKYHSTSEFWHVDRGEPAAIEEVARSEKRTAVEELNISMASFEDEEILE
jgi:hypothetical protein